MQLDGKGALAAAQIAFFVPAFLFSILVCVRQGFGRNLGWLYLVLLSVLRIVGASCVLYSETQNDYSTGLLTTAAITSAVGTAPLLLALLGIVERVHAALPPSQSLPPRIFRPVHLLSLVALGLAIVGGVLMSENDPGTSTANAGKDCFEAGAILFLAVFVADAAFVARLVLRRAFVPASETKLVAAGVAVLPFLLVRLIYSVCVAFADPDSKFYYRDVDVYVEAFMMFLMEVIVIAFYIAAGLATPKRIADPTADGFEVSDVEMHSGRRGMAGRK